MSVPTNTVQTVAMVGIRESLKDDISILSPAIAKFYNALGEGQKPKAVKHEFETDTIRASADNAAVEGDDPTIAASTQPVRLFNNCQIQEESYSVTSTANAVVSAGKTSEKDYQGMKKKKALLKDVERAYLRGVLVTGSASVAFKMKGALNWLVSNLDMAADATLNADGTVTGGTARPLEAALVKSVMQDVYSSGGGGGNKVLTGLCNVYQQSMFDAFASGTNLRRAIENGTVDDKVDIYVTAFGKVKTDINTEMPTDQFAIVDMDYFKKSTLEEMGEVKLATSSALNEKYHITVNHTLESKNETASGRITNLTTS